MATKPDTHTIKVRISKTATMTGPWYRICRGHEFEVYAEKVMILGKEKFLVVFG